MAGPVDAFLKVSIAAAALFASASVGYYYVHYLPQRDAQLDQNRKLEAARADLAKQADYARQAAEKRASEERQTANREALQARYRLCVSNVERNYSETWAEECRKVSAKAKKDRADCYARGGTTKDLCDAINPVKEYSEDCSLPNGKAINEQLERSRARCLQESQLGLQ
jgi:hypothetical protein